MKKILSFVLVLAMIASMMCVSVSAAAADLVVGTTDGEGNRVGADSVPAGAKKEAEITANVSTNVTEKYAIELTYSQATITVDNDVEWNVETLMYEGDTIITVGDSADSAEYRFDSDTPASNTVVEEIATFSIVNYSSQPITVQANVTPRGDIDVNIIDDENENVHITASTPTEIAAVKVNPGERGDETIKAYTASMTCDDWAAAFATAEGATVVVATITFVFAAN